MTGPTDTHTDTQDDAAIAARLLDEMSAPQQHAIDAAPESTDIEIPATPDAVSGSVSAEYDDAGEAWNPEVHATGANGRGVKTAKGTWRRRRGAGGRSGSVVAAKRGGVPPEATSETQARAAGVACAHALFVFGRALGGEEWSPRDSDGHSETRLMESAFGDYFVATGRTDFPPGLALTMAVSAYALPRFTMPQTKSRITRAKQWIATKWIGWKDRKKAKDSRNTEKALQS